MATTYQKHLNDVRRRLLYPDRSSLDDVVLSPYIIETIDELLNKAQNTHEPGLIRTVGLTVVPGQASYLLDAVAPNYGKARYLYTRNINNDPNFTRRPIELVDMETAAETLNAPASIGVPPINWNYINLRATVFNDADRGLVLEFTPIPRDVIYLDFAYELLTNRPPTKQSRGFIDCFDAYVAALSALRALVHCKWKGIDRDEAKERKAEIRQTLLWEIGSEQELRGYAYTYWQFTQSSYDKSHERTVGFLEGILY